MNKVVLTKDCRDILSALKKGGYAKIPEAHYEAINYLIQIGFITATEKIPSGYMHPVLTNKGQAYLYANPKLKNPSIWDDKKYWITTGIAILALFVSFVSLLK